MPSTVRLRVQSRLQLDLYVKKNVPRAQSYVCPIFEHHRTEQFSLKLHLASTII